MSSGFNMQVGGSDEQDEGFVVKTLHGCRVVYGSIPLSDFGMLTHGFSKKALLAPDIADRIGATVVIGEPEDLEVLRSQDLPVSPAREPDALAAQQLGLPDIAEWLRTGQRGASSNAMCKRMYGVPADARNDHPHDPDDLRRCLAFLDITHSHDKVSMMSGLSPEWTGLVLSWEAIVAEFKMERSSGTAPKTYALMRAAISGDSQ